jgi:hypothetical protein
MKVLARLIAAAAWMRDGPAMRKQDTHHGFGPAEIGRKASDTVTAESRGSARPAATEHRFPSGVVAGLLPVSPRCLPVLRRPHDRSLIRRGGGGGFFGR